MFRQNRSVSIILRKPDSLLDADYVPPADLRIRKREAMSTRGATRPGPSSLVQQQKPMSPARKRTKKRDEGTNAKAAKPKGKQVDTVGSRHA